MEIIRQRIISNNTQRPVAYIVYIIGGGMIILPRVNYEDRCLHRTNFRRIKQRGYPSRSVDVKYPLNVITLADFVLPDSNEIRRKNVQKTA